jgi:ABC-2 type transport system permease protein
MPTDAVETPFEASAAAPAALAPTRPFYWSVRREIWENRSLYIAPAIAAGVVLIGITLGAARLANHMSDFKALAPERQAVLQAIPYNIMAVVVILTSLIVGITYSLGALYNERRDRSILFWKSLPVSDLTAVMAKASVPLAVLPAVAFAIIVASHLVMLLFNTLSVLLHGQSPVTLWTQLPLFRMWVVAAYGLVALALWNAPLWSWQLLVSAWAKRVPFLWAVLPPLALCVIEKIAFDTSNFAHILGNRLGGGAFAAAFTGASHDGTGIDLDQLDPVKFLTSPGLWGGLVVAAGFLAATVWLRRRREPI